MAAGRARTDLVIRPYERSDRARVREICFRTGFMGEPVDWQGSDAESFADLFSSYYTDQESHSAFVVDRDGVVGGYLLGCVDTSRASSEASIAARHLLRRGIAFRRGTAATVWRTLGDTALDVARRRTRLRDLDFEDARWPAHFHVDLLPEIRGCGAGRRLVDRWFETLRAQGVVGCHLRTFAENRNAVAFFEALGFRVHGPLQLAPGLRSRAGARLLLQVMVRELD